MVDSFPTVESPNGLKVQKVRLREMAEALLGELSTNRVGPIVAARN